MATDKATEMTGLLSPDTGLVPSDTQTGAQDLRVILLQELSAGLQKRVESLSTIMSMFNTSETKLDKQFIKEFRARLQNSGRTLDALFSSFTDDADARNVLLKEISSQVGIVVYNKDSLLKIDTLFQFLILKEDLNPDIISSVQKLIALQIDFYLKEEAEKVRALEQLEENETQLKEIQTGVSQLDISVLNEADLSNIKPTSELPEPDKQDDSTEDCYAGLEMADFLREQDGHSDDDGQSEDEDVAHPSTPQDLKLPYPEKPGMLRQAVSAAVNSPTAMIVGGIALVLVASNVAMPVVAAAILVVVATALITYGLYLAIQSCRTYRRSKAVDEHTPLVASSSSDTKGQYFSILGDEDNEYDDKVIREHVDGDIEKEKGPSFI